MMQENDGEWIKREDIATKSRLVYDPRIDKNIISDNPALVMATLAEEGIIKTEWVFDEVFWENISHLADYCDSMEIEKPDEPLCFFNFGSHLCSYIGDEESCDKTLNRCKELGNEKHFPAMAKR
jgi:hypothetical protein